MTAITRLPDDTRTRGEAVDWEVFYRQHLPGVYNFFRYRFGDNHSAEDLTATTFEKAWRNRKKFYGDPDKLTAWLFTIARNVAIDFHRSKRQEVPLENSTRSEDKDSVEKAIEYSADLERLSILLDQLSARDRELIGLKYGAGLTNRAIASLTDLTESNVGTIIHRTVSRLRDEWEK